MDLSITAHLDYELDRPTDILLLIETAGLPDQIVSETDTVLGPVEHRAWIPGEEGIGQRLVVRATDRLTCDYTAKVRIDRPIPDIAAMEMTPIHRLPGDAIRYLMASRYCPSDEFQSYVDAEFGKLAGGARIAAMRDWIEEHIAYVPGSSNAQTTSLDTFVQRQGICRDFAHVMVTLARASAIPARVAGVYAPDVDPQDFHAVAEIYLDGGWHLVDATGMAGADSIAKICVGRDAADVAFMTSYGIATFAAQRVDVQRI